MDDAAAGSAALTTEYFKDRMAMRLLPRAVKNAPKRKELDQASSTPAIAKKHVRQKYDLDIDTLECPICSEPFSPPVYQCKNGHTACWACCTLITKGCPSCSKPIGHIRNIAIEKVIESLQVDCKHAHHGCNTMVKYTERDRHENNLCEYRPIRCPVFKDCTHIGPKVTIPMHMAQVHRVQTVECSGSMRSVSFKMKASDACVMFKAEEEWLLVCCSNRIPQGDSFFCCSCEASKEVAYKLTVKPVKLNRKSNQVYSLQDVAHDGSEDDWPDVGYLYLPGRSDEYEVTVSLV